MKVHLSMASPPRTTSLSSTPPQRRPSQYCSTATPPRSSEPEPRSSYKKSAKASAVATMSDALAGLETQTLFLVTTAKEYHHLVQPEYTSLSLALGLSYEEYVNLVVEGGFLRPISSTGTDKSSKSPSLGLCSDDPFSNVLPPSKVKALGLKEVALFLNGVKYHFLYRSHSAKTYVIPALVSAPHEIVESTHSGGEHHTPGRAAWGTDDAVNVLAGRVEGMSLTREGESSAKKAAAAASSPWRTQHPSEAFADKFVQHGLDLKFDVNPYEYGERPCRNFQNSLHATTTAPASSATVKMTYLTEPTPAMKLIAVHMAVKLCHYHQANKTRQTAIAKAMVNIVCYDFGFDQPRGYSSFPKWIKELDDALLTDTSSVLGSPQGGGTNEFYRFGDLGSGADRVSSYFHAGD